MLAVMGPSWELAREEILLDGQPALQVASADWRPLLRESPSAAGAAWPWYQDIVDPARGTRVRILTTRLRTDGVTDAFFAMGSTPPPAESEED
jgi:hypothetical protein